MQEMSRRGIWTSVQVEMQGEISARFIEIQNVEPVAARRGLELRAASPTPPCRPPRRHCKS